MRIQKVIRPQGQWAIKGDDIKDGDVVKLADAGQIIEGDYGGRHVFKIQTRNGEKIISLNQKSLNNLVDAFGEETNLWVGKSVKLWIIKAMVTGKLRDIVYVASPSWAMTDSGDFYPTVKATPNTSSDNIPVIDDDYVPF